MADSDMSQAPASGRFLAESIHGDWLVVRRFDPGKPRDFSANAVINPRTGIWWHPKRWRPIDKDSPAALHPDAVIK
jgi:hypothetical protein